MRTLTDIQRETVFVSVEKVTRMRGSRGGPLPEVGPHGVGVGDAKGRAKGKQDVGDPERDAGVPATPTPVGAACTVNSRNPLQRRRAISMLLSPPDERDKMRTHPNCHNCHRLPPTVTNTHGKNTNTHGKSANTHGKNTVRGTAKTPTRTAKAPTRTAKTPARTAKTPARSGAECGVKAISAIGCAAQLAEQHKPRARARTHRGRTRAQWPQHPGPSSPRKSRVCDCSHTQCSNT